jgi:hypothetical protein
MFVAVAVAVLVWLTVGVSRRRTASSSEMSVMGYQLTRRHVAEDLIHHHMTTADIPKRNEYPMEMLYVVN